MGKTIRIMLTSMMIIMGILIMPNTVQAKQTAKVNLHLQNKKVVVKKPKILKKAKKVKLTVKKKSVVKATLQKKKKQLTLSAKKKGFSKVVLSCKMKNKKRKQYTYNVNVKAIKKENNANENNNQTNKGQGFIGKVTIKSCSALCVGLEWPKQDGDVMFYKVERKTVDGEWKSIGNTQNTNIKDYDVVDGEVYFYRVIPRLTNEWMEPSEPVMVVVEDPATEEPAQISDGPLVTPSPMEEIPTEEVVTSSPTPEPTPYVAQYSYEVEVLNKFNIYEDVPIVLFIKTDNPNPNGGEFGNNIEITSDVGSDYNYGDLKYLEQENTNHTFFNKVDTGWIYTVKFDSAGLKTVEIQENINGKNEIIKRQTIDTFQIEVKDGAAAENEYCNKVIEEITNDEYNADGRGKWSELDDYNKILRVESYIKENYNYSRSEESGKPIWYIQENIGAFWETGYVDCGASNYLLRRLAEKLGYETEINQGTLNGKFHINAFVTVNGEKKLFDATPGIKGYPEWDYIM